MAIYQPPPFWPGSQAQWEALAKERGYQPTVTDTEQSLSTAGLGGSGEVVHGDIEGVETGEYDEEAPDDHDPTPEGGLIDGGGDGFGSVLDLLSQGWEDFTGVTAARIQEEARQKQAEEEARRARDAQAFFQQQSAQGVSDLMGGAQMGTQAIQDYGGLAAGAIGESADAALQTLIQGHGGLGANFQGDPGYQFRLQQGEEAINRNMAARGGRGGTRAMQALAEFNQGLASQEFGNYAQRETDHQRALAGLYGQTGGQMANVFGQTGSQLGNIYTGVGQNAANIGIGVGAHNSSLLPGQASSGRYTSDSAGTEAAMRGAGIRDAVMGVANLFT